MPDIKTDVEMNPRQARRAERDKRLKLAAIEGGLQPTVKVWPANETMRRILRHANGVGFRSSGDQPVEWPNDGFTARRIRDGDVVTDGPATGKPLDPDPKLSVREQAAARRPKPKQDEPKGHATTARPKPAPAS